MGARGAPGGGWAAGPRHRNRPHRAPARRRNSHGSRRPATARPCAEGTAGGGEGSPGLPGTRPGQAFFKNPPPRPPRAGWEVPSSSAWDPRGDPPNTYTDPPRALPPPPHHRHGQTLPAKQQAPTDLLTLASADQTNWSLIAVGHSYGLLEHALSSSSDSSDKVRPPLKRGLQLLRNPVLNAACPQSHRLTTPRESSSQAGWKKAAV